MTVGIFSLSVNRRRDVGEISAIAIADVTATQADSRADARAAWAAKFTDDLQQQLIDSVGGDAERVFKAVVAAREACS